MRAPQEGRAPCLVLALHTSDSPHAAPWPIKQAVLLAPLRSVQFSSMLGGQFVLRPPFTEGYAEANEKGSPPGRQQRCIFKPLYVQFRSVRIRGPQLCALPSSACCESNLATEQPSNRATGHHGLTLWGAKPQTEMK